VTEPANPFGAGVERLLRGDQPAEVRPPRPAATVIILRDGADGAPEVYLVCRARQLAFMGGAYVFPGGRVDATDDGPAGAACREAEEEVGVRLDREALRPWARWVTPEIEPKRFDAWFFVARLPEGESAEAVLGEVTGGLWISPRDAVRRQGADDLVLPPPTLWNLLDLCAFETVEAVLASAADRSLEPIMPRPLAISPTCLALVLPGDPAYDAPSSEAPPIEEQRRFLLDGSRWEVRGHPYLRSPCI